MFQKQYILNEGSLEKEEKNGCTIIYKNGFPDDVIDKNGMSSRKLYGFPKSKDECVIQDFDGIDGIVVVSDNDKNGRSIKGDYDYNRFWRGLVLFPSGTIRYFPTLEGVQTELITKKYRHFINTIGEKGQRRKNLFTDEGFPMYGQELFKENKPILPDEQGWVSYIDVIGNADNKDVTAFISTDGYSTALDGLNIDGKIITFDEDVEDAIIIELPDSEPLIQLENESLSKIIDFTGKDVCQGWGKLDRIKVSSHPGKFDLKPHMQEFFALSDDDEDFQIFRTYPKVEDIVGLYHINGVNVLNSVVWIVERTRNRGKNMLSPRYGEDFIFNEFVDDIYCNSHKSSEFYGIGCFLVKKDKKLNLVEYKTLKPVLDKFAIDIKILFNPISQTYPYIVAKFDNNIEFYSAAHFDGMDLPDNITDVMTDEENHIFFTSNGKPRLLIGSVSHTPYIECNMCLNTHYGYLLQVPNGYKYLFGGTLSETFDGIYDIESLFPIVERNGKFNYLDIPNGDVVFKNTWFDDCESYEGTDMYNVNEGHDFTVTVNGKQEKIHFQQRNNFSIA